MHRRALAALASVTLAVAGLATLRPAAASAAPPATALVPRPDHVVIAVEENKAAPQIVGNADAPFITSLAANGANFTSSYAITHPSQPNYLALFSGSTQGITDDSCPHSFAAPSLGDQLIAAGHTFTGYSESMPSAGYAGCSLNGYARKHNPWADFPAVPASANQPFTAFPSDYSQLPDVSFVIPNLQHDMHDGTVAQGDSWLQANLGGYIEWARTHNSLFVLTFDEDDNSSANRIATVFAGQPVVAGTYAETINHYNVLRTVEDAFGLPLLGASATAAPITDVWTGNRPPTASFTASCPTATCSFDASASGDPDGTITGYTWDFGDGATGQGVAPTHQYAAGRYTVTLTVTDDAGATATTSRPVSVGVASPFVLDTFNRTVTGGLGTADVGGAWATSAPASAFAVRPGAASLLLTKAGAQLSADLPAAQRTDADVTLVAAAGAVPVGGPVYMTLEGRRVSTGNEYAVKVLVNANRSVTARLTRVVGGSETVLGSVWTAPFSYTAGSSLDFRLQVTGTGPTQLRARLWPDGTAEPATWPLSATDSTPALQQPGAVGVIGYLSSAATNAPLTVTLGRLAAAPTGGGNAAPTAAFTSSCAQLVCHFDAGGSSDAEGPIAGYTWDFGDGATGTGATPQHAYAVAGDDPVTLTVTDGQGATGTVTHTVTATAPPVNQPPVAAFTASCSALTCSFDGTGSTDDEGVTGWSWDFGDGATGSGSTAQHTFAAAGTYPVTLTVTDDDDATGSVSHPVPVPAGASPFVVDTFDRTVTGGWGAADTGGTWTIGGTAANTSVADGAGSIQLPKAGAQVETYLPATTRTDADVLTSFAASAVPAGSSLYVTVEGRRVSAGNFYAAKVLINADRTVTLRLVRFAGGVETVIGAPVRLPGVTYTAGLSLSVRLQVTGTGPTVVRARAWASSGAEPGSWPVSASDSTAALQHAGAVGLISYLSSAATNAPITVAFGPITARPTGAAG